MIGRIRGTLVEKNPPEILIDTHGVGYEIQLPMTSFYQLPETGDEAIVFTHFVVREDAQLLFGFATKTERTLFRELIKANGVGPKLALTILSGMSAEQFVHCVQHEDVTSLVKLPGVGKKTAERLLIEMRDRLKNLFANDGDSVALNAGKFESTAMIMPVASASDEAISALMALGYSQSQAAKSVKAVAQDDLASEDMIRRALKAMV